LPDNNSVTTENGLVLNRLQNCKTKKVRFASYKLGIAGGKKIE